MLVKGPVLAAAGYFGVVLVFSADFLGIVARSGKDFVKFLLRDFLEL
jgi:hypothetical protein